MGAETTTKTVPSLYALWNYAPAAPTYLVASVVTSIHVPQTTSSEFGLPPFVLGFDVDCPPSPHPQHSACAALGVYPARVYQSQDGHFSGTITARHASETTQWRCSMEDCGLTHGQTYKSTKWGMCTGIEQAHCALTITNAQKKVVTTTTAIDGCEAPHLRIAVSITAGFDKAVPWPAGDAGMMEGVNGDVNNLAGWLRNVTDGDLDNVNCPTSRENDLEAVMATASANAGPSASPATGAGALPAETSAPVKSAGVKTRMGAGLFGVVLMACAALSI